MSLTAALIAPEVLLALEYRLQRWFAGNHAFHWSWEHLMGPAVRAALVALFVLIAYPALFGLRVAPDVGLLLAGDSPRLSTLVGAPCCCRWCP
jgi:hypothetical protein